MFTTKYPPLQALSIGQLVLASENYGSVTKIAKRHKISRSTCYNYAQKASFVSENWSLLLKKQCTPVIVEKELFILQEYVLHHSSIRAIINHYVFGDLESVKEKYPALYANLVRHFLLMTPCPKMFSSIWQ